VLTADLSKVCASCKEEKAASEFKKYKGALHSYCRPCTRQKDRGYYKGRVTRGRGNPANLTPPPPSKANGLFLCRMCEQHLPATEYYWNKHGKRESGCKDCHSVAAREYNEKHRERNRAIGLSRYANGGKERQRQYSRANAAKILAYPSRKTRKAQLKSKYHQLRSEMFDAYGHACTCCGEAHREFLTLEHLKGGGTKHRRAAGGTYQILLALKASGWPKDDYTVLCMNCNWAERWGDPCPHKTNGIKTA
jgi:hypothetical protein